MYTLQGWIVGVGSFFYAQLSQSDASGAFWKAKTNLHMMQELCEHLSFTFGSPSGVCEYMDEGFVGAIAELAMRRGGVSTHKANLLNLMDRYTALLDLGEIWEQRMRKNNHHNNNQQQQQNNQHQEQQHNQHQEQQQQQHNNQQQQQQNQRQL